MVQYRRTARIIETGEWLGRQIRELTDIMDGDYPKPWSVDDAPAPYIDAQMRGIVCIEIEITAITGKWKVSQNWRETDCKGVVDGLKSHEYHEAYALAGLVAERLNK